MNNNTHSFYLTNNKNILFLKLYSIGYFSYVFKLIKEVSSNQITRNIETLFPEIRKK